MRKRWTPEQRAHRNAWRREYDRARRALQTHEDRAAENERRRDYYRAAQRRRRLVKAGTAAARPVVSSRPGGRMSRYIKFGGARKAARQRRWQADYLARPGVRERRNAWRREYVKSNGRPVEELRPWAPATPMPRRQDVQNLDARHFLAEMAARVDDVLDAGPLLAERPDVTDGPAWRRWCARLRAEALAAGAELLAAETVWGHMIALRAYDPRVIKLRSARADALAAVDERVRASRQRRAGGLGLDEAARRIRATEVRHEAGAGDWHQQAAVSRRRAFGTG